MKLIVSVQSVSEAELAAAGRADLIDIKDPASGSLGRASEIVLQQIIKRFGNRYNLSAALGELRERACFQPPDPLLSFTKFGLAHCINWPWQQKLLEYARQSSVTLVPTIYADAFRAQSPSPQAILDFVIKNQWHVVLIDTWKKDGSSLFDWLSFAELDQIITETHAHGSEIALAGSLTLNHVPQLHQLKPDWVAVRGAVCEHLNRSRSLRSDLVLTWHQALSTNNYKNR